MGENEDYENIRKERNANIRKIIKKRRANKWIWDEVKRKMNKKIKSKDVRNNKKHTCKMKKNE